MQGFFLPLKKRFRISQYHLPLNLSFESLKVFHNTSSWNPQLLAELVPEFERMREMFLGYLVLDIFIK